MMRLYKRKGYEDTTVRTVTDDSKNPLAIIGTVKDLKQVGLFDYCTADDSEWAVVPPYGDESDVRFTDSKDEAIKLLK